MPNLEFAVPYNGNEETLQAIIGMKSHTGNRIREVYLGAPQDITGSGRVGKGITEEDFLLAVKRIRKAGIRADITMNSTCDGSEWYEPAIARKQIGFIQRMHEDCGVEAVTLANPFLIERARKNCPNLEISASVLSDIDCYSRAATYANAGANVMTVDTAINKDIKLLGQIVRNLGVEIKLMVNEGCLYKCPYRKFHMNYISHKSKASSSEGTAFSFACGNITKADPGQVFKSNWVRPEDLSRYDGVTRFFKIVGRDMLHSKVLRCTKAYLEESYDGNLFDILCSSIGYYGIEYSAHIDNKSLDKTSFFKRTSTCNRKCHNCTYCEDLANEHLGYGWVTEENLLDLGQSSLANAVKARFGGSYPVCPRFASAPEKAARLAH